MSVGELVVHLPSRDIGLPAGLSDRAKTYLSTDLGTYDAPDQSDIDGWREAIARRNAAADKGYGPILARLDVDTVPTTLGGVPALVATPREVIGDQTLLDFHGGGCVFYGGEAAVRFKAGTTAARTGRRVFSVDFRTAPDNRYPAALDDAVAAYRGLLKTCDPAMVVVSGTSSGGGLASALLLRLKSEGIPMPAGLVLLTPLVDLTLSGDSFSTLDGLDPGIVQTIMPLNLLYAGGASLDDPMLSPLFGNVEGFPETFLQAGGRDRLLSDTLRFYRKLRNAGVVAKLHVWDGMPHGGFGGGTPEDREVTAEIRQFLASLAPATST